MKFQRKIHLKHHPQRNQMMRLIAALDMVLEQQLNEQVYKKIPNSFGGKDDTNESCNLCQSFIAKAKG